MVVAMQKPRMVELAERIENLEMALAAAKNELIELVRGNAGGEPSPSKGRRVVSHAGKAPSAGVHDKPVAEKVRDHLKRAGASGATFGWLVQKTGGTASSVKSALKKDRDKGIAYFDGEALYFTADHAPKKKDAKPKKKNPRPVGQGSGVAAVQAPLPIG